MRSSLRRGWALALTVALALQYAWIGLAAHGIDRALALLGATAIPVAVAMAAASGSRRGPRLRAAALLAAGVLPLAVADWWTLLTPLLAALAVAVGLPAILSGSSAPATMATATGPTPPS